MSTNITHTINSSLTNAFQGQGSAFERGQKVIVAARWCLVFTGLLLTLWNPAAIGDLRIQITVVLALAVANFYLHAQILMRKPTVNSVVYGASIADLTVITLLIVVEGGFGTSTYIFYFPAIMALAVTFPAVVSFMYVGYVVVAYIFISLMTMPATSLDIQVLITRILMIVAVAYCGYLYRKTEQTRLQAADEAQKALLKQIKRRREAPAEAVERILPGPEATAS